MSDFAFPRRNELVPYSEKNAETDLRLTQVESQIRTSVSQAKETIAKARELMARTDNILAGRP